MESYPVFGARPDAPWSPIRCLVLGRMLHLLVWFWQFEKLGRDGNVLLYHVGSRFSNCKSANCKLQKIVRCLGPPHLTKCFSSIWEPQQVRGEMALRCGYRHAYGFGHRFWLQLGLFIWLPFWFPFVLPIWLSFSLDFFWTSLGKFPKFSSVFESASTDCLGMPSYPPLS